LQASKEARSILGLLRRRRQNFVFAAVRVNVCLSRGLKLVGVTLSIACKSVIFAANIENQAAPAKG
jgi:hypothetical protein